MRVLFISFQTVCERPNLLLTYNISMIMYGEEYKHEQDAIFLNEVWIMKWRKLRRRSKVIYG